MGKKKFKKLGFVGGCLFLSLSACKVMDPESLTNMATVKLWDDAVDSDGDGMPDGFELAKGIKEASQDNDKDGLSNLEEYQNNTDPKVGDSDLDGFIDSYELEKHMNPLKPDTNGIDKMKTSKIEAYDEEKLKAMAENLGYTLSIYTYNNGENHGVQGRFTEQKVENAKDAMELICNVRGILGIEDPVKELKYKYYAYNDTRQMCGYVFAPEYDGVEYYGHEIGVFINKDQKVNYIGLMDGGRILQKDDLKDFSTKPKLSEKEVYQTLADEGYDQAQIRSVKLYICLLQNQVDDTKKLALRYMVRTKDGTVLWVDGSSGYVMGSYGITNERWEELLEHREEKNAEEAEKKATAMELLEKADIRGKISHDDPELDFEYIQDGVYENDWRYRYYVVFKGIKLYDYDITITTNETDKYVVSGLQSIFFSDLCKVNTTPAISEEELEQIVLSAIGVKEIRGVKLLIKNVNGEYKLMYKVNFGGCDKGEEMWVDAQTGQISGRVATSFVIVG